MNLIYNILWYLATPMILTRLWWRGGKQPGYRQNIGQRFGRYPFAAMKQSIWLHAVSFGEMVAAEQMVRYLLESYPNHTIVITNMTATGAQRAQTQFATPHTNRVQQVYLPYDLPGAVRRFLDHFKPEFGVIMETELWPNLLTECRRRQIPIMLANARLSKRSTRGYARIRSLTRNMLSNLSHIGAQSRTDAKRFEFLGAAKERISVLGNLKYDLKAPPSQIAAAQLARAAWPKERPTFIAASTHEGEETLILDAFKTIKQQVPTSLLILVPRHPDRFDDIASLCVKRGWHIARHSLSETPSETTDILLGDTMGEMFYFYALSDIAVVCGSFAPIGGHNILEPISLGIPVVTGPYLFHLAEIRSQFPVQKSRLEVDSSEELANVVIELMKHAGRRDELVNAANKAYQVNQGALERHCRMVESVV